MFHVPLILPFIRKRVVEHGLDGLLVALHNRIDVFRATGTTLDLKDAHTRMHHLVDETDGLQVLGRHDILVVDGELVTRLIIGSGITATTYLDTLTTIGRAVGCMETHIALAADGHAEGSVTEHLDTDLLTAWAADVLGLHLSEDLCHLIHIQFTSQHHHIGKLGVEAQSLDVGDIQLRGKVHLLPHPITIGHHRHIRSDDGGDASLVGRIDDLVHQGDVLAVDDGIHRQITLDAMFIALTGNVAQVIDGERRGRVRPHIQFLDAKVDTVSPSLDGCGQ